MAVCVLYEHPYSVHVVLDKWKPSRPFRLISARVPEKGLATLSISGHITILTDQAGLADAVYLLSRVHLMM